MGVVVQFDPAKFKARYPEFASLSDDTLTGYFGEASIYHCNDGTGPVCDPNVQLTLLNMMTAHIAARYAIINGKAASPIVGRISNASEGSVSVGTQNDYPPGTAQWYQQTKYGSDYWIATSPYRRFLYRAPEPRNFEPFLSGGAAGFLRR